MNANRATARAAAAGSKRKAVPLPGRDPRVTSDLPRATAPHSGGAPRPQLQTNPFGTAGQLTISFWCGPPHQFLDTAADALTRMQQIASDGFTLAMPACNDTSYDAATNLRELSAAATAGIKVVIKDPDLDHVVADSEASGSLSSADRTTLQDVAATYDSSAALAGYFLTDEPCPSVFAGLNAVRAALASFDPTHPPYIDFFGPLEATGACSSTNYLTQALSAVHPAIFSFDSYAHTSLLSDLASVSSTTVPFADIVESANTSSNSDDPPTDATRLWEGTQSLAYGSSSISYFTYWQPDASAKTGPPYFVDADGNVQPESTTFPSAVARPLQTLGTQLASTDYRFTEQQTATSNPSKAGSPVKITSSSCTAANAGPAGLCTTIGVFDSPGYAYSLLANGSYTASESLSVTLQRGASLPQELNASGQWTTVSPSSQDSTTVTVSVSLAPGAATLFRAGTPVYPSPDVFFTGNSPTALTDLSGVSTGQNMDSTTSPTVVAGSATGSEFIPAWAYVRGSDGDLHQVAWSGSAWSTYTFPLGTTSGTDPSAVRNPNGHQDVYFSAYGDQALWDAASSNGTSWTWTRIPLGVDVGSSPAPALDSTSGTEWVYFNGQPTGYLWEVVNSSGSFSWSYFPISVAAGTSPAVVEDHASTDRWVYLQANTGALWTAVWNGSSWSWGAMGGPAMYSHSSAVVTRDATSGDQWVYYENTSGHLESAIWNGSNWSYEDFGSAATMYPGTRPTVIRDPASGQQWVYFEDSQQHLALGFWTGRTWEFSEVSPSLGMAKGTSAAAAQPGVTGQGQG